MTTLKNCERCGQVFNSEGSESLCGSCSIADAKDIKKVTDFLKDHPLASIMEVTQRTGLPQQLISRYVKSGMLKMRKATEQGKCRLCGADIKAGTLCGKCREKIEGMQKKEKRP